MTNSSFNVIAKKCEECGGRILNVPYQLPNVRACSPKCAKALALRDSPDVGLIDDLPATTPAAVIPITSTVVKKPYTPPVLRSLGRVGDMTLGSGSGPAYRRKPAG